MVESMIIGHSTDCYYGVPAGGNVPLPVLATAQGASASASTTASAAAAHAATAHAATRASGPIDSIVTIGDLRSKKLTGGWGSCGGGGRYRCSDFLQLSLGS